jgi:3-dehydroquinate dehydratase-1
MICTSIGIPSIENCQQLVENRGIQLAEIRLDGSELSIHEVKLIFTLPIKLIATCRPNDKRSPQQRKQTLLTAIEAGATFVDIEIEAEDSFKREIIEFATEKKCKVIISYHNYELTPPLEELHQIIDQCVAEGANIAKIACQVNNLADSARILSLYDCNPLCRILALGMGDAGKVTRIAAPLLGAPFTYASPSKTENTAPGQLDRTTLANIYRLIEGQ